ncbi:MAG: chloride channel protein [Trueperaceae bacterium]|nr:chloride channel protein [Trueperaceae bacterium]
MVKLRKRLAQLWSGSSLGPRYRESSETISLVVTALIIGLLAGLGAVVFDRVVHYMGLAFEALRGEMGGFWGSFIGVMIPVLGGILVTPIVVRWSPDVRGSGIPGVMYSVSNLGGRLPKRIIFWRPIASGISIGTGASLGSEGPVVQLSASMASVMADFLRLNDERRRSLAAVAAASGIAATFNAPIAGVLFALEVVLGKFTNKYFSSVVIGAVAASALSRRVLGPDPAFAVPNYALDNLYELPLYLLLGALSAFIGIAIIRVMVAVENEFNHLRLPPWLRPAFGGLLIGLLGLALPEVLGRGFEVTGQMLRGDMVGIGFLLAITFGKMLAMGISLGSWHSGGIFAPILFVGAAFGLVFAQIVEVAFPALTITPGAFALVGMAAVFAGAERAPMSTIVMVFEMSNDYQLILPLLLAAVIATLIADVLHPESIYHVMLSRKGQSLLRLRQGDLLQTVLLEEVMDSEIPSVYADDSIERFAEVITESHHHGFLVVDREDPDHFIGIITLTDLERARREGRSLSTELRNICQQTVYTALPTEAISEVLERMAQYDIGRMPVVSPQDKLKVIGFVRQSDLARAYYQAVQRHRRIEEQEEATRLRDLTGQEIIEVKVRQGCKLAGLTLREAKLPKESIVVAIRRGGRTIFPHGDTKLEPGDTVVANVAPGFGPTFRALFNQAR